MLRGFCVSVANACRRVIGNVLSSSDGDVDEVIAELVLVEFDEWGSKEWIGFIE